MPADAVRTQRALEVLYATGRPLSSQQGQRPPAWRILELGLNPPDLSQRIHRRTRRMYQDGLVEETAALLKRFGPTCPLLDTMGYAEARQLLAGELEHAQAIALTERRTRQYAKRQLTWFRRRHQPLWLGTVPGNKALEDLGGRPAGLNEESGSEAESKPGGEVFSGTEARPLGGNLLQEVLMLAQNVLG
jgi:tRNA A37 N6-isopentenylltransferase MiaA